MSIRMKETSISRALSSGELILMIAIRLLTWLRLAKTMSTTESTPTQRFSNLLRPHILL